MKITHIEKAKQPAPTLKDLKASAVLTTWTIIGLDEV
jgi:hypothetical protein